MATFDFFKRPHTMIYCSVISIGQLWTFLQIQVLVGFNRTERYRQKKRAREDGKGEGKEVLVAKQLDKIGRIASVSIALLK